MSKILVVEDDVIINQVICEFLKEASYDVYSCFDGEIALQQFEQESFDLIILDIMIPKITGLEVLKKIREQSDIPIMMLTAIEDEATQLFSFNQQISDYIVKPFSPLILVKRIENIFRNQISAANQDILTVGAITIQQQTGNVYQNNQLVALTKKEYEILVYLAKNLNKVIARDTLMLAIWGYSELDSRVLDNHIKNLRKKLPNLHLQTIIGRGYKLTEE